ncbi:ribbon-helix-helix domain-containing protein [Oscillatoria acuminata]|uniref:Uncharacterized protein n=1 Tax=Oscillatoria acuminata PCC 6304 TaxID=56110 RepID=K9TS35_9CYAN|nr:ribbon-helix-helix domain-containing protein [Oscillatoria acuminata]AFY84784.1 hypothetical protein Oscil6304_5295 [Oscillatoria acuminata PCC 6304]
MSSPIINTNIRLPAHLLEAMDQAVQQGKAKSRDEFIMQAIRRELEALKRAEIDAELAEMVQDPDYQLKRDSILFPNPSPNLSPAETHRED